MFYKKLRFPEEGDYVLCTVKKILFHSVFVDLDEYRNMEGIVHISEVSPGRIRNLRDYVKEGKRIICKVLRVSQEKNQIDLSLRRVSVAMLKKKTTEYKQEEKAEKILELVAKDTKSELKDVYSEFGEKIMEMYGSLNAFFQAVVKGDVRLEEEKIIPKKYQKILEDKIKEKIKPVTVKVENIMSLRNEKENGVEILKKILLKAQKQAETKRYDLKVTYIGAPRYKFVITASTYKEAEKELSELKEEIISDMEKEGGIVS